MCAALLVAGLSLLCGGVDAPRNGTAQGRVGGPVVVVSLDGLGTGIVRNDPVASELRALHALRARGVMADGLVPHMPSTTANTHAALWTGAWGDVNGIVANEMPLAPRSDHSAVSRVSGYRSEGLRAEPLWVAAARQGVPVVAQQATQVYPFSTTSTGGALRNPPVIVHGYQARVVAPARWLTADDLARIPCGRARKADACFAWNAGPVPLQAELTAAGSSPVLRVRVEGRKPAVSVRQAPVESAPPRGRELARHFSDGLLVDVPDVPPAMVYFRLFDATADGRSLLLFQSAIHETAAWIGRPATRAEQVRWLLDAGGFVGNGRSEAWDRPGKSGTPLWLGGSGERERRYLETIELGVRQTIRQADELWRRHGPRLFVGYVSMPDEMDHAWLGHAVGDARYEPVRRWGYQLVDRAVETYVRLAGPSGHVVFVSDHGMQPVTREVRVAQALHDEGLMAAQGGRVVGARSQVLVIRNCIQVHTDDWRGGVVPVAEREEVIARTVAVLRRLRDPETDQPVVTSIVDSPADRDRLGFGGPNGADFCFDLREGYVASSWIDEGPVVRSTARPSGEHGFLPTRADMHGVLIAAGPRLPAGGRWPVLRAIDVAPLVSDLLGIAPPRDARGRSPLDVR